MEMEYFTEQAASYSEAVAKAKERFGDRAQILTHRTIRMGGFMGIGRKDGVEINGYVANDLPKKKPSSLEEEKRKFLELAKAENSVALTQILAEVKALKSQIADGAAMQSMAAVRGTEHENISKVQDLLELNEFSPKFVRKIMGRLKAEFTLDELDNWTNVQDRVLEWIGECIQVYAEKPRDRPHVFILVGPTGVGKTTTIAKLAARSGIGAAGLPKQKVRIITIDNYRIGAKQQIETFGEIMGIPVNCAETPDDLRKYMAFYQDVDLIFIDTIGKSPKDYENLGKMRALLKECGASSQVYLAMSATTKGSDMLEIAQQFEPFNYKSTVITKLDETNKVGSLISTLWEKQKSISYITDGQVVPHDIEPASAIKLLLHLEGFRVNRDRLEKNLSVNRTEQ
jgi:flagellar biosynthesis protein FlhF